MNSKEFKNYFNDVAKLHGFEKAFGAWFKISPECILVLELQKSNYGDYYEMNVKIFIQGAFGYQYVKNKFLAKRDMGDIFTRQPKEFGDVLDFDIDMDDDLRIIKLENLFNEFIVPFAEKALSISGIRELQKEGIIFIMPAVEDEIRKLENKWILKPLRIN
ncbi:hypothetical protein AGMMS50262_24210 [Bacteroidia bacterium]|nr:hypothetical protein AGMMS50262_24210 [Bacteroidia bacterium]